MTLKNIPPKKFHQWTDAELDAADAYIDRLRNPCDETKAADIATSEHLSTFINAYTWGGIAWADWQRQKYTDLMRRIGARVWSAKVKLGIEREEPI